MRALIADFEKASELGKPIPQEVLVAASTIQEPGRLADFITFHLNLKVDEKQEILEALEPHARLEKTAEFLRKELEILELGSKIQNRVKDSMNKTQREYFLREQLKAIQQELGQYDEVTAEIEEYKEKIAHAGMPEDVEEKALVELGRSREDAGGLCRDLGHPDVSRLAHRLAVGRRSRRRSSISHQHRTSWTRTTTASRRSRSACSSTSRSTSSPTRCAARSCASSARPAWARRRSASPSHVRWVASSSACRLGGVRDEAEIRGHRRTYVGALPGRIIQSISQAGSKNPVFMMDEIDKVGADFRGDPTSALLEVLDPEQNNSFQDHYLEAPFDLSNVIFITTANLLDPIPPALRDRMEVIHFPGYTEDEKLHIAKQYLIPKQLEEHGLTPGKLEITDEAIREIVRRYTREAGVRNLERTIAAICRQVARMVVEGKKGKTRVTLADDAQVSRPAQVLLRAGRGGRRGRRCDGTRLDRGGRRCDLHRGHARCRARATSRSPASSAM